MKTSWIVRILTGFGALMAALFLLGALIIAEIVDSEESAIAVGLVAAVLAALLRALTAATDPEGDGFFGLLAVAVGLGGQVLFMIGAFGTWEVYQAAAIALVVQILLFLFFHHGIARFVAAASVPPLLAALLHDLDAPVALDLATLVGIGAGAWLWTAEARRLIPARFYKPATYGLLAAVLGLLLPTIFADFDGTAPGVVTTAALVLLLAGFLVRVLDEHEVVLGSEATLVVLATLAVVAIATHEAPGILASLGLMTVAFHRQHRRLMATAAIFFAIFLSAFYYHLDISLLEKSWTLVASGAALLGLRFYLNHRFKFQEA